MMSVDKKHIISIVIPFYNGQLFLGDLLSSLSESYFLSSKLLIPEIIIINDSPEISEQSIRLICNQTNLENNLNIKIFSNPENKGVAFSRDYGTAQASGDFITWIDQDDFVHQTYFSVLEQRLQSQQNVYLLNGYLYENTTKNAVAFFYFKPNLNFKHVLFNNPICSTFFWIFNREFLNTLNYRFYLPEIVHRGVDDWYFSLQLTRKPLKFEYVSNRLLYYRIHENNFSRDVSEAIDGSIELLKILQKNDCFPKRNLQARIVSLKFAKRFHTTGKISSILSEPFNFLRLVIHYCYDKNSIIIFFRKIISGKKFKFNNSR